MPGPGGGNHGGGGYSGNFGSGGGFGSGNGIRGGSHYGNRSWGSSGSSGNSGKTSGGMVSFWFIPTFLFILAAVVLIIMLCMMGDKDSVTYNEYDFRSYADTEYQKAFSSDVAYEDNLLIVVLTNQDADDFYYIAWVGDHIAAEVKILFGNEKTVLGKTMATSINKDDYRYTLDVGLADTVSRMIDVVDWLEIEEAFECNEEHIQSSSRLINYTTLPMNGDTVNSVLTEFTEKTGVPISIVVSDEKDVFEKSYTSTIVCAVLIVVIIGVAIAVMIWGVKEQRKLNKS